MGARARPRPPGTPAAAFATLLVFLARPHGIAGNGAGGGDGAQRCANHPSVLRNAGPFSVTPRASAPVARYGHTAISLALPATNTTAQDPARSTVEELILQWGGGESIGSDIAASDTTVYTFWPSRDVWGTVSLTSSSTASHQGSTDYPSARLGHAATAIAGNTTTGTTVMLVHGGATGSTYLSDLWALNVSLVLEPQGGGDWEARGTWREVAAAGAVPSGRQGHALVEMEVDSVTDDGGRGVERFHVMYGGIESGLAPSVQLYVLRAQVEAQQAEEPAGVVRATWVQGSVAEGSVEVTVNKRGEATGQPDGRYVVVAGSWRCVCVCACASVV